MYSQFHLIYIYLFQTFLQKLRAITKVCGLEKKRACLYVPLEIFAKHEVRASIDGMIDVGYDLSLFSAEELEIMCQRQGYFLNMAENTKNYFHCIIFGKEFTDISKYFPNENMVDEFLIIILAIFEYHLDKTTQKGNQFGNNKVFHF